MKLYDAPVSGNCYKVRLLLGLLGKPYEKVSVDLLGGEAQSPELLALNPRGQLPILVDGERVIWDSQAILVYVAREYGDEGWLPLDTDALTAVMQWLALSENELLYGLARARRIVRLGAPGDLEEARHWGRNGLEVLEARLQGRRWLVGDGPTIADVACYPYVEWAPEGEVSLDPYPSIQYWLERIESLPGFEPQ